MFVVCTPTGATHEVFEVFLRRDNINGFHYKVVSLRSHPAQCPRLTQDVCEHTHKYIA